MNKKIKILFVDDEPWGTEALRLKLEGRGFICNEVKDMSSALNLLNSDDYGVVVTDIMMPAGLDFPGVDSSKTGIVFTSMIRNKYPDIQIICLSVIGDQEIIKSLKKKGILYIRKGETSLDVASKIIESKATGTTSF